MKVFDIKVRSYFFSRSIVLFINKCEFGKFHYPIIVQLLRSATSIGANIIEAKSGNSVKHLINYYSIALRSANETKYWLCLIRDTMNVDKEKINFFLKEVGEISNILAKSIISLKRNVKVNSSHF